MDPWMLHVPNLILLVCQVQEANRYSSILASCRGHLATAYVTGREDPLAHQAELIIIKLVSGLIGTVYELSKGEGKARNLS